MIGSSFLKCPCLEVEETQSYVVSLLWWPGRFCVESRASASSHGYIVPAKEDRESERVDGRRVEVCCRWESRPQVLFLFSGERSDFLIVSPLSRSLSRGLPAFFFFSPLCFSWQYSEYFLVYRETAYHFCRYAIRPHLVRPVVLEQEDCSIAKNPASSRAPCDFKGDTAVQVRFMSISKSDRSWRQWAPRRADGELFWTPGVRWEMFRCLMFERVASTLTFSGPHMTYVGRKNNWLHTKRQCTYFYRVQIWSIWLPCGDSSHCRTTSVFILSVLFIAAL